MRPEDGLTTRRALIVAIASHPAAVDLPRLASDRDAELLGAALRQQRFGTIEVLAGAAATRQGIVEAFRRVLVEPGRPGDLALFHFSGHGQQIADDGGDEPDGYDETLVPYDAPTRPTRGYRGQRHLRDDELAGLIRELRQRLGPAGQVVVLLDACFSGTPRGDRRPARGLPPLGAPARSGTGGEPGSGFIDLAKPRGGPVRMAGEEALAPYVVLSAARHDELAWEIWEDGRSVGSLTYGLTRELAALPPPAGEAPVAEPVSAAASAGEQDRGDERREWTYRRLLERIRRRIAGQVPNRPQVEGAVDLTVFAGGLVVPEPFVEVRWVADDGRRLTLAAGLLAGLSTGSRVEVHAEGTLRPEPTTLLAVGEVVDAVPTEAVVELAAPADGGAPGRYEPRELEEGRAFITHHAFGALRLTVRLEGLEKGFASRLTALLHDRVSAVDLVEDDLLAGDLVAGDVGLVVRAVAGLVVRVVAGPPGEPDAVMVETADGTVTVQPPLSLRAPEVEATIARRLLDYARNRTLRHLRLDDADYRVDLEVQPVRGVGCRSESTAPGAPTSCRGFEPLPAEVTSERGRAGWRPGDLYRLRVHHRGRWPAHLNILALQPDGVIRLLWPPEATRDRTALAPGASWELPGLFAVTEPAGSELLLSIASERWIDLAPFVSRSGWPPPAVPRGDAGPFAPLLHDTAMRAERAVYPGGAYTDAVALKVLPAEPGKEER